MLNNLILLNKSIYIYVTYVLKLLHNDTEMILIGPFSEVKLHNRGTIEPDRLLMIFISLLNKTNILIIQNS